MQEGEFKGILETKMCTSVNQVSCPAKFV